MNYRKLRIALSVAWGIPAVLLIALWLRSYWRHDSIWRVSRSPGAMTHTQFTSDCGTIGITYEDAIYSLSLQTAKHDRWQYSSGDANQFPAQFHWNTDLFTNQSFSWRLTVPDWFLVLIAAAFAIAPFFPWRFSLRTLLIATTLFAVGLGLIMWSTRKEI